MERKELYKRENALTLERAREDDGRRNEAALLRLTMLQYVLYLLSKESVGRKRLRLI